MCKLLRNPFISMTFDIFQKSSSDEEEDDDTMNKVSKLEQPLHDVSQNVVQEVAGLIFSLNIKVWD